MGIQAPRTRHHYLDPGEAWLIGHISTDFSCDSMQIKWTCAALVVFGKHEHGGALGTAQLTETEQSCPDRHKESAVEPPQPH